MLSSQSNGRAAQFFDETMKLVSYCPLCENRYNFLEARVLVEGPSGSVIYLRCQHCRSAIVGLVLHHHGGVSSVGIASDLQPDEVLLYQDVGEVTEDDILANYQHLQKIDSMLELVGSR